MQICCRLAPNLKQFKCALFWTELSLSTSPKLGMLEAPALKSLHLQTACKEVMKDKYSHAGRSSVLRGWCPRKKRKRHERSLQHWSPEEHAADTARRRCSQARRELAPETQSASTLILDFNHSRIVKKISVVMSCYANISQKLVPSKTAYSYKRSTLEALRRNTDCITIDATERCPTSTV